MRYVLILLLMVAALRADRRHWQRSAVRRRAAFRVWAVATDVLPLVAEIVRICARDNTPGVVLFGMWCLYGWLVFVLPRMVWYLFAWRGWRRTGYAVAIGLTALFVWGATAGRTRLAVTRIEVRSPKVPPAFDGFRIVQLSDIHLGSMLRPGRELQRMAERVGELHPDLIVFTGDLIDIRATEITDSVQRLLGRMRAPEGVFSVTGNHDVGTYVKDTVRTPWEATLAEVTARQSRMGWHVLDNATRYIRRGGDSIAVSGIAFDPALRENRHDRRLPEADWSAVYGGIPQGTFNITLAHLPQLWPQIVAWGYGDLTLSGHVHAMQTKVRLFGRAFSPARILYPRWSGRYDDAEGHTLYINDGAGCVAWPMRLGAPPEITLITLKSCE